MNLNKNKTTLLILILALILVCCGAIGISAAEKHLSQKEEKISATQSIEEDSISSSLSETESDTGSTVSEKSSIEDGNSQSSTSSSGSSKKPSSNSSSASPTPSRSVEKSTGSKEEKTTKAPYAYYCTVTIECSVILDNMDDLKEGKENYVPSSGYILNNYSIKAQAGESVYSVLKRACRENGIPLEADSGVLGIYVSGINNLNEKDCGPGSGWEYEVNGKSPGHTAENEKIKKDSAILWKYVTHP